MSCGAEVMRKPIRSLTKAVMCPCRNPGLPPYGGPGMVLVIIPTEGYSRSRNYSEKDNQKYKGSRKNNRIPTRITDTIIIFALHQALFQVLSLC